MDPFERASVFLVAAWRTVVDSGDCDDAVDLLYRAEELLKADESIPFSTKVRLLLSVCVCLSIYLLVCLSVCIYSLFEVFSRLFLYNVWGSFQKKVLKEEGGPGAHGVARLARPAGRRARLAAGPALGSERPR